eukprot:379362_1
MSRKTADSDNDGKHVVVMPQKLNVNEMLKQPEMQAFLQAFHIILIIELALMFAFTFAFVKIPVINVFVMNNMRKMLSTLQLIINLLCTIIFLLWFIFGLAFTFDLLVIQKMVLALMLFAFGLIGISVAILTACGIAITAWMIILPAGLMLVTIVAQLLLTTNKN